MKLLYLHQYYNFPENNGGTRSHDLANAFKRHDIDVTVVTSSGNIKQCENQKSRWIKFEQDGIKYYALKSSYSNKMGFARRILSFVDFMFFASIKCLQIKSDVVLATSTPLTIVVPAIVKRIFQKVPYVFEIRDVWPEVPIEMGIIKKRYIAKLLRKVEVYFYKKAFWIIPLSEGMKSNILQRYNTDKMTVIPNISEINRFQGDIVPVTLPLPSLQKKKIIVYCGTIGIVNGLKYLVDLAVYTKELDSTINYWIFGCGNQEEDVLEYAKEKNVLNDNLFFLGTVSKKELPYIYSLATMGSSFVQNIPILWDNSANKFFDSLAAGRPVLINHYGWQADAIKKHNCGYVLSPVLDNNAAKEFVRYVNNLDGMEQQRINALRLAKNEYSLEIATSKYMSVFRKISYD